MTVMTIEEIYNIIVDKFDENIEWGGGGSIRLDSYETRSLIEWIENNVELNND
jgi:hypothetical protein